MDIIVFQPHAIQFVLNLILRHNGPCAYPRMKVSYPNCGSSKYLSANCRKQIVTLAEGCPQIQKTVGYNPECI